MNLKDSSIDIRCTKSAFINENVTCSIAIKSERQTFNIGFIDGLRAETLSTSKLVLLMIFILILKYNY